MTAHLRIATTTGPRDLDRAAPGRLLLRWWFPKAATPHCALQARLLFGSWAQLTERGVDVLGLSYDDLDTLAAWSADLGLPFPLAAADLGLAEQRGAARDQDDPWRQALPRRLFDVVDEHGSVRVREVVTDANEFLDQVTRALERIGPA